MSMLLRLKFFSACPGEKIKRKNVVREQNQKQRLPCLHERNDKGKLQERAINENCQMKSGEREKKEKKDRKRMRENET